MSGFGVFQTGKSSAVDEITRRRLVHNEELFRAVNEAVSDVHGPDEDGRIAFLCECSDRECAERIRLTANEYREVRRDPLRFAIVPGHEVPEIEDVVERNDDHDVVEKIEAA